MAASPSTDKRVLIVARSGRALAQAAVLGGWSPWVIDQFADLDTLAVSGAVVRVAGDGDLSFAIRDLLAAIAEVQDQAGPMPLILGGAFESTPELVAIIARSNRICGCGADVIRATVDIPQLFERLRRSAKFRLPATQRDRPADIHGWLRKRAGACGGGHVRRVSTAKSGGSGYYFQRYIEGRSMSALLIAGTCGIELCGLAEHLRWHPNAGETFRYEGARLVACAPSALAAAAVAIGADVADTVGIIGCFGIDFIVRGEDDIALVDINPRPTATLDLYPDKGTIFNAHMTACTTGELLYSRPRRAASHGHLLLYADASWVVPESIEWPSYVADRPVPGITINRHAPLCTVGASAQPGVSIMTRLASIYDNFFALISRYHQGVLPQGRTIRTMGDSCHAQI